jgi:hypothetical protein
MVGCVFNFKCTSGVVRKFHLRQQACPFRSIATREATKKLLKRANDAFRLSIYFSMSTWGHVDSRSKASPKTLLEATNEFRVTVTDEHSRQSV